ncbi:Transposon Polyprotein Reverse transcriptase [Phytophthora palmivora]|uniref:Transposon Polyprotein Reverse transcriptase n=1 Tax=Phytophthora palmivora TaxID=4796 RepID=A0A2P4XV39_9STRA|nr:Transposon Polyprotein Reverse transcriptase [Phytophthora palmivora]
MQNDNGEHYKARLVACGDEKVHGVNNTITFSPVIDTTSTEVMLVLLLMRRVPALYGDVPNTYVKAETEPDMDIHLRVPQVMAGNEDKMREHGVKDKSQMVLRLRRGLGGFFQCSTDTCMYFKTDKSGTTVVGVYVDDLLVTGTSKYTPEGAYTLDREATIDELLDKFGLQDARSVTLPIGPEKENDIPGDVAYAVHKATRQTHAPTKADWVLAKRIARYLKCSKGGCDAPSSERKSVSGVMVRVNGDVVGWLCKKQTTVALSSMEAEFIAAAHAAQDLMRLRECFLELPQGEAIDVKYKFSKDLACKGIITPTYIPTGEMVADLLTKSFVASKLHKLRTLCGLDTRATSAQAHNAAGNSSPPWWKECWKLESDHAGYARHAFQSAKDCQE